MWPALAIIKKFGKAYIAQCPALKLAYGWINNIDRGQHPGLAEAIDRLCNALPNVLIDQQGHGARFAFPDLMGRIADIKLEKEKTMRSALGRFARSLREGRSFQTEPI
jgi:hypothetical protein